MNTVRMKRGKKFKGEEMIMNLESIIMKISEKDKRRLIETSKRNEENIESYVVSWL